VPEEDFVAEERAMNPKRPTDKQLIATAKKLYHDEGSIEIDDAPEISKPGDTDPEGVYVQAWVWVAFDDVVKERP
jgi:hypothetical protein